MGLTAGGQARSRHITGSGGQKEEASHMPAPRPQAEPLLTPAEVATMFRVDPKTVTRWAKNGRITSIRTLGGHRRYRETEVRALLAGTAAPSLPAMPLPDPRPADIAPEPAGPAASPDSWMVEALRQGASIDAIAQAAGIPAGQARRRLRAAGARP